MERSWLRHLGAFCVGVVGFLGVLGLVLAMNLREEKKAKGHASTKMSFVVQPPPPRPPVRRKVRPKRRSVQPPMRAPRAPLPRLASSLSGVDFGIPSLASTGLDRAADALLGKGQHLNSLVMTEKSVDQPPQVQQRVMPRYPPRARAQGVTGRVTLRLLIGRQGQVLSAEVTSATPPGVFDQVALAAVRQWRFQPAMYKGQPVKVQASQVLRFQLQ